MTTFIITPNRLRVKGGETNRRLCKGLHNDLHILDLTHQGLVMMHSFQILAWKVVQQGMDDLHHVTKGFEGDADAMDRGRLGRVDPIVLLSGQKKGIVHRLKDWHAKIVI